MWLLDCFSHQAQEKREQMRTRSLGDARAAAVPPDTLPGARGEGGLRTSRHRETARTVTERVTSQLHSSAGALCRYGNKLPLTSQRIIKTNKPLLPCLAPITRARVTDSVPSLPTLSLWHVGHSLDSQKENAHDQFLETDPKRPRMCLRSQCTHVFIAAFR